jgi:hypothetical protein
MGDSNLPPGVTGNEYQIAGPDREWDDYRECDSEGFSTQTITDFGTNSLNTAIDHVKVVADSLRLLGGLDEHTRQLTTAVHYIRQALSDVVSADVDGKCPFGSDVSLESYLGVETWECPICRVLHQTEEDR